MSHDVVSFMLRFVRDAGQGSQARWRGLIRHVQGDSEKQFTQFREALEFMQAHVNSVIRAAFDQAESETGAARGAPGGEQEHNQPGPSRPDGAGASTAKDTDAMNPFLEAMRLWGEMLPQYNKIMMDNMTETMRGVPAQMQQAMEAMVGAFSPQAKDAEAHLATRMGELEDRVKGLTDEVETLRQRVAELEGRRP